MSRTYKVNFITSYSTTSQILRPDEYHDETTPHLISSATVETYGSPAAPTCIRISNGGLGPTGIIGMLCNFYLRLRRLEGHLRFEWVANHSRHSQIALQARVVDIALTYERDEEVRAQEEGWCDVRGVLCHDHFLLVGPVSNPAGIAHRAGVKDVLKTIAEKGCRFHTRGDGSATMHKEHELWTLAGIEQEKRRTAGWYERHVAAPVGALIKADSQGAYTLTDRATFLACRRMGEVNNMAIYAEGGEEMMNTCALGIRSDEKSSHVLDFVHWLYTDQAQGLIAEYGKDWANGKAVVTRRVKQDFETRGEKQAVLTGSMAVVSS